MTADLIFTFSIFAYVAFSHGARLLGRVLGRALLLLISAFSSLHALEQVWGQVLTLWPDFQFEFSAIGLRERAGRRVVYFSLLSEVVGVDLQRRPIRIGVGLVRQFGLAEQFGGDQFVRLVGRPSLVQREAQVAGTPLLDQCQSPDLSSALRSDSSRASTAWRRPRRRCPPSRRAVPPHRRHSARCGRQRDYCTSGRRLLW